MRRREFIGLVGGATAWPLAAPAQQPKMPVIGVLSVAPTTEGLASFRKGLNEHGFVEGRNVTIEFRHTEQYNHFPELAAELVRRRVAVILTRANVNAALAAKAATTTIPIVFTTGFDPVQAGLVPAINRPGGNITGVTFFNAEMGPKRLELLRELVPQATTIAFLVNSTSPLIELSIKDMQAAARSVGQQIIVLSASTPNEIEAAFATLVRERAGGLLINNDAFFAGRRDQFIALAALHRIPSVYFSPEWTAAGGLMSYSDDRSDSWRQAGRYVGRILKGEKPADLPVLQPTKLSS
jgi:putative ABC transport system substrate-binding protein